MSQLFHVGPLRLVGVRRTYEKAKVCQIEQFSGRHLVNLSGMNTNSDDDQQALTPDPRRSAPIEKMLTALDDLIEATKRVAVERSTNTDRIPDDSQASVDRSPDSR